MNKAYEIRLVTVLMDFEKLTRLSSSDLPHGYMEGFEVLLPALKEHGFVKNYTLGEPIKIDWPLLSDIKKSYPTIRGSNPNENIMRGVEAFLKDFCAACDERYQHIPLGSFEKLGAKQCVRDVLVFFKDKSIIKDFVLYPARQVVMQDPAHFLSKNQLAKIAQRDQGKGFDI